MMKETVPFVRLSGHRAAQRTSDLIPLCRFSLSIIYTLATIKSMNFSHSDKKIEKNGLLGSQSSKKRIVGKHIVPELNMPLLQEDHPR